MKTTKNLIYASLGLCAGLLILAACSPAALQPASGGSLTGPVWSLSTLGDQPLVAGTSITANFSASGKVSGSSGCNQYSGTYTTSGNSIQVSTAMASTMMACELQVMNQEDAYLRALGRARFYEATADQLTLKDASNKTLLVYKAQSQDLSGTSWEAISYNNGKQAVTSVMAGTTLTADFGKAGILSGNSGCNTYNGPYKATGIQIEIGPLASTMKACAAPEGVMDQEAQYLAALGSAAVYHIEGNTLELRTQDGALAASFHAK